MGIYDDVKTIITITRTVDLLSDKLQTQEKLIGDLKDRVLVLEASEDAITLSAKEAARQALYGVLRSIDNGGSETNE